ncbi:Cilia- and flagella-associated protein 300 [Acropora cervicornis]|uniref:Cilia- and flagella-associated protein 300 n=1 Tax=Acropora cervicornis TaxID=6130 RepID=A0AAD9R544_ACRCE|nr:Cilia- and flagella-associated protein 300 [Acropora cervicornis]
MADDEKKFSFQFVPNKIFPGFESSDVKELFVKWGMSSRSKVQMFSYDQLFQVYQKDIFVLVVSSNNTWAPLNTSTSSTTAEVISCSVTSMDFFDRLQEQENYLSLPLEELSGNQVASENALMSFMKNLSSLMSFESVHKDPTTKKLQVGSVVLKVSAQNEDGAQVYPSLTPHEQSFAYMCISPLKRHVYVWSHSWR